MTFTTWGSRPCDLSPDENSVRLHQSGAFESQRLNELTLRLKRGQTLTFIQSAKIDANITNSFQITQGCRIFFDLWANHYDVERWSGLFRPPPTIAKHEKIDGLSTALRECLAFDIGNKKSEIGSAMVRIHTILNPVDDDQMKKTREWLSQKGFAGHGSSLLGRVLNVMLDLKADEEWDDFCSL
jgi:hypothetical protein